MEKVIIKVKPKTVFDKLSNQYTIFDENNRGGAIISNVDPFEALRRFKEGTQIAIAVKTLMGLNEGNKKWYVVEYI